MQPSRRRILELLKRSETASVSEISEGLGLTQVTIRHHLEKLLDAGLVQPAGTRGREGPGRPESLYRVTDTALSQMPRNYEELVLALLGAHEHLQILELCLRRAGERRAAELLKSPGQPKSKPAKEALAAYLEARGYFPKLDESQEGFVVTFRNCPYFEAAVQSRRVCTYDLALLQSLLGARARLVHRQLDPYEGCRLQFQCPGSE